MDSDELERGTGGQGWFWRLTERGLVGREEGEWRGENRLSNLSLNHRFFLKSK